MSFYILLINWTDQGIKKIKDSPDRYTAFKRSVEKAGGKIVGAYYTFGEYDVVLIIEAASDDTVLSIMLGIGSYGNVRSKTLRAFTANEGKTIIDELP